MYKFLCDHVFSFLLDRPQEWNRVLLIFINVPPDISQHSTDIL